MVEIDLSMEMMNKFMPLFSLITVYALPVGVGLYWIIGAVVRTVIQILVNKRIDNLEDRLNYIVKANKLKDIKKNEQKQNKRIFFMMPLFFLSY